jgi:hypothetical protein
MSQTLKGQEDNPMKQTKSKENARDSLHVNLESDSNAIDEGWLARSLIDFGSFVAFVVCNADTNLIGRHHCDSHAEIIRRWESGAVDE